jgi:SPP1 gp7 family putative phage head morphogenesis protein
MSIGANGGAVALAAMLGNFSKTETDKTLAIIKTGYYQGERISDISASITGTRANNYADGAIGSTKRNAKAVSRTASDHVTNTAKTNVYKRNQKAVQGYILTAVLDSKTSKTCRGLDDKEVYFSDDYQPSPPFHVNCRTVKRPLLRDDLDRIKRASRQTIGAGGKEYEPTGKQYYTWLRQQPKSFQDDILGKTEGAIFRNSGLTPQEFKNATINRNGKPLTIAEMAEKDKRIAKYLEL